MIRPAIDRITLVVYNPKNSKATAAINIVAMPIGFLMKLFMGFLIPFLAWHSVKDRKFSGFDKFDPGLIYCFLIILGVGNQLQGVFMTNLDQ
jgi:hypothetical protein